MKIFVSLLVILFTVGCAHMSDKYMWLENIDSADSKAWVEKANQESNAYFRNNKYFEADKKNYEAVLLAEDRLPSLQMEGEWLYETRKDRDRKQGLFRRIKTKDYIADLDKWQSILDLDVLSAQENKKWVLSDVRFLDGSDLVLLALSNGGADAIFWREFNLKTKEFIANSSFNLPESKSRLQWYDKDTLIVRDAITEASRTNSGYARHVRIWKRGEKIEASRILFSVPPDNVGVDISFDPDSRNFLVHQNVTFTKTSSYNVNNLVELTKLQLPIDYDNLVYFKGYYFIENKKTWQLGRLQVPAGSILSWPAEQLHPTAENAQIIFKPTSDSVLSHYFFTKSFIYITTLKNIKTSIAGFDLKNGKWTLANLNLPTGGIISFSVSDRQSDDMLWLQSDFLQEQRYIHTHPTTKMKTVKKVAPRFEPKNFEVQQYWAQSKDGTKIPYFIVHKKEIKLNGQNAVWLSGYGGFEVSRLPSYLGAMGKIWLAEGGVYVVANIRGGGEFGPAWHQAAILENKQKSYDDFIAIAEDLIKRKISSPKKIGIEGGSNGGLLVGAVAMQRPDLFKAVLCHVPLLDMLRYHKLLAGASWMAEFGNPDIPEQRQFIEKYSPYQNVKEGVSYPEFFFYTSTKDDRVHPGHARKMAAKLQELGQPVLFFEKQIGGHSRGTALLESAELYAKFSSFFKVALALEN